MMQTAWKRTSTVAASWCLLLALVLSACAGKQPLVPPGTGQADRYLFDRAQEKMAEKSWVDARTYFLQIVDNYPQSPLRPEAKLGIGDSYLGENQAESLVMAANEFREFLSFYPTSGRADYAQYKLAMSHYAQMRAADRDQTESRAALREFDAFFERHPKSPLTPEVREKWREAKDRVTEASYRVALFYFRQRWYQGAIARLREILADDAGYSVMDGVYYHLAESLARTDKPAEALPYFDRLLTEYPASEFGIEASRRVEELKQQ